MTGVTSASAFQSETDNKIAALERRVMTLEKHDAGWSLPFAIVALATLSVFAVNGLPRVLADSNRICVPMDAAWPWENQAEDLWMCATSGQVVSHSQVRVELRK